MAYETDNRLYGRTSNPWDLTRTAGGSSGGESAAIAVGLSAGGLGSDGGGSHSRACSLHRHLRDEADPRTHSYVWPSTRQRGTVFSTWYGWADGANHV